MRHELPLFLVAGSLVLAATAQTADVRLNGKTARRKAQAGITVAQGGAPRGAPL